MPAVSKKQRRLMAIAEHNPEEVYKKNRGVLGMSMKQLGEYASTSERSLPAEAKKNRKKFKAYAKGRGKSNTGNLSV